MRRCPFPNCEKVIGSGYFCCKPHWWSLPDYMRNEVMLMWQEYKADRITIKELRRRQHNVVIAATQGGEA
jgi:hypothetical protein